MSQEQNQQAPIGMADEEDANNRDTVTNECANSPLDMMPPDESGALPPGTCMRENPIEMRREFPQNSSTPWETMRPQRDRGRRCWQRWFTRQSKLETSWRRRWRRLQWLIKESSHRRERRSGRSTLVVNEFQNVFDDEVTSMSRSSATRQVGTLTRQVIERGSWRGWRRKNPTRWSSERADQEEAVRDHDIHLTFTSVVYEAQRRAGRHATTEHPYTCRAWKTRAYNRMRGFDCYVDQCGYAAWWPWTVASCKEACHFSNDQEVPLRQAVEEMPWMSLSCSHWRERLWLWQPIFHGWGLSPTTCQEAGRSHGWGACWGGWRPHHGCPGGFATTGGRSHGRGEEAGDWTRWGHHTELPTEIRSRCTGIYNYVKRLHQSLGHPQPSVLKKMLTEVQATLDVLKAAGVQMPRLLPSKATLLSSCRWTYGTELQWQGDGWLCMDRHWGWQKVRGDFLGPCNKVCCHQDSENRTLWGVRQGLGKRMDQGFWNPTDPASRRGQGMELEVHPRMVCWSRHCSGSCPWWNTQLACPCGEETPGGQKGTWITWALHARQRSLQHQDSWGGAHLRPAPDQQHVYGERFLTGTMGFWQNPSINSLTAELFNPGCDVLDDPTKFADIQRKRVAAQKAWINADSHAKLRCAMNKIFQEVKDDVQIGQKVWFWRKAGTGILQKAMWRRGPARVVAKEVDEDGKVLILWPTHGTSLALVRCSPLVEEQGSITAADPEAALRDLQWLRARSTTQLKDLTLAWSRTARRTSRMRTSQKIRRVPSSSTRERSMTRSTRRPYSHPWTREWQWRRWWSKMDCSSPTLTCAGYHQNANSRTVWRRLEDDSRWATWWEEASSSWSTTVPSRLRRRTRRRLARERKRCFSSSSDDGSRKR